MRSFLGDSARDSLNMVILRLLYLIPFFIILPSNCLGGNASELSSQGKALRKEYRRLTDEERKRFHAALDQMKHDKTNDTGPLTKYDLVVVLHEPEQAPAVFFTAGFLPWHRQYLYEIEKALRQYDSSVTIPYWDPTLDEGLPDPRDSILWTQDFLGNGNGNVTIGPFKDWKPLGNVIFGRPNRTHIERDCGGSLVGRLISPSDVENVLSKPTFSDLVYCKDPFFESVFGAVHLWVGGDMEDPISSPNDPADILLDAFVDLIWEEFRQRNQNRKQRETDYPSGKYTCDDLAKADSPMKPFDLKIIDGLSNNYTDKFYFYDPRPTCSPNGTAIDATQGQCGSPYLACDQKRWRCLSKVRIGGNCTGFEHAKEEICFTGTCVKGECKLLN